MVSRVIGCFLVCPCNLNFLSRFYFSESVNLINFILSKKKLNSFTHPIGYTPAAFHHIFKISIYFTGYFHASADGPRKKVELKTTNLTWGNNHLTLSGDLTIAEKDILLDSKISADGIDWVQIKSILDYIQQKKADPQSPSPDRQVLGTLKVYTEKFNYDSYSVQPLEAQISFKPDKVSIAIEQAVVCSINFRGLLNVHGQTLEIYLVPAATDQKLAPAVACVTGQKETATGTFNLSGELLSKSKPEAFVQSLAGNVAFTANTGRQFVAGQDPMQTQAAALATQGVGSYSPYLQAAQTAQGQAAGPWNTLPLPD